jgi:hypothetical protein
MAAALLYFSYVFTGVFSSDFNSLGPMVLILSLAVCHSFEIDWGNTHTGIHFQISN